MRKVDLNLLKVFIALMNERSVTRAAKSLYVTQSAVSISLSKLRVLFKDELFIRSSHGIIPTEKAIEIAPIIKDALHQIALTFDAEEPAQNYQPSPNDLIRIALSDEIEELMIKRVFDFIESHQLAVNFTFIPTNSHFWDKLLADEAVDVVICSNPNRLNANHQSTILFSSTYSCIYDNTVHQKTSPIRYEEYINNHHARVIFDGGRTGFLDEFFELENKKRKIKATFSNYSTTIHSIIGTELLVTIPLYGGLAYQEKFPFLNVDPVPLKLEPTFVVQLIWATAKHNDPKNQWIREMITEIGLGMRKELSGYYSS